MNPLQLPTINISAGLHRNNAVFFLRFYFNTLLIEKLKSISARWSQSNKCWYLKNTETNLTLLFTVFKDVAWLNVHELKGGFDYVRIHSELLPVLNRKLTHINPN